MSTIYQLVLQNHKEKTYRKISWLVVAMNFFAFLYIAYQIYQTEAFRWPVLGASLMGIWVIMYQVKKNKFAIAKPNFLFPFFISMVVWMLLQQYWFMAAILLMIFLEAASRKPLKVTINEEMIDYPSFPRKEIEWSMVNNLLLKDDLLTIDLKNNKLMQSLVNDSKVNEEEFNHFCKEQIMASAHKKIIQ